MTLHHARAVLAALALFCFLGFPPVSLSAQEESEGGWENTPEGVVRGLYDLVTFPAGSTPDWDAMRTMFLPEPVIVLRTSREGNSVYDMEGFVQEWLSFLERGDVQAAGFVERIVRMHSTEFGDIAHVWVLYEAEIPGGTPRPQPGVDSIELVRRDGTWLIAAITNEIPTPERPIPEVLRGGG